MTLYAKEISMNYGDIIALDNVSIVFEPGIYGLLGPNGAGKSTLMSILVGNIKGTQGAVFYNSESIDKLGCKYREIIGFMPQQQNMYTYFTGRQFLEYVAALKGISYTDVSEIIETLAEKVNLLDKLDDKIKHYSGGMKQRLLIAQAIMGNPSIIILDEPTAGLDPKERVRIRNLISEIAVDKIVIVATHVVSDIEIISKEIIMLKSGRVVEHDSVDVLTQSIAGKVYELEVDKKYVEEVQKKYLVSNVYKVNDKFRIRVISDKCPEDCTFSIVIPTLEDKYLSVFEYIGGESIE